MKPALLRVTARAGAAHVPYLRRQLRKVLALVANERRCALEDVSVALVGDARMSELHKRFMGIAGPTDVLTFPLDKDDRGRVTSGEVVVCVAEAVRQAKNEGAAVQTEMLLYAIHGILHLLGMDDRSAVGFERMHRAEDRLLMQLGLEPALVGMAHGKLSSGRIKKVAVGPDQIAARDVVR